VPHELGKRDYKYLEAVKAQAVAARTYTYCQMLAHSERDYDLYADVTDQVYRGCGDYNPVSDLAVRETQGMVLNNASGELIKAYYHSTCGGVTAACSEVWPYKECFDYLVSVDDKGACSNSKYYTWKYSWTINELHGIVRRHLEEVIQGSGPFGNITDVYIKEKTPEGRVAELNVETVGKTYSIPGDRCRWVLRRKQKGDPILLSAFFNLVKKEGNYVAEGRGYGHGVGMCQMGALGRALKGESYTKILETYYKNIRISDVSELKK
ncbi:MAG: SpoIID/LytB domain-containing protein, partial [bacterium]